MDIDFCRLGTERIAVAGAAIFRAPRVRALDGALRLGLQPRQLRLSFYGMALRYDRVPDRRRETAVLFGGPVVNLILWVLLRNPANGALFLLNMLPIFRWMGDGWRRFGCHNDWRPCSAR